MIKKTELKKKFARYPSVFGKYSLTELCDIARKNGMKIIVAYHPDMHVSNEIGLYGTQSQMIKTESEWGKGDKDLLKFNRRNVFGVSLTMPKNKWVDKED